MDKRPHKVTCGHDGPVSGDIGRLENEIGECQADLAASAGELKRRVLEPVALSAKTRRHIMVVGAGAAIAALFLVLLLRRSDEGRA